MRGGRRRRRRKGLRRRVRRWWSVVCLRLHEGSRRRRNQWIGSVTIRRKILIPLLLESKRETLNVESVSQLTHNSFWRKRICRKDTFSLACHQVSAWFHFPSIVSLVWLNADRMKAQVLFLFLPWTVFTVWIGLCVFTEGEGKNRGGKEEQVTTWIPSRRLRFSLLSSTQCPSPVPSVLPWHLFLY